MTDTSDPGKTVYVSSLRRHDADACESMEDVRYEVDRIDRLLVEVLAERVSYMRAAARIKPTRDKVRDEPRIEEVVSKVLAEAGDRGLPAEIAEPVWRELIERCIAYEMRVFDGGE